MPFSSGTFSLFTPGNPVVTGTTIASTWANNTLQDVSTGLSTCVLKDGSQTTTARVPFVSGISTFGVSLEGSSGSGQVGFLQSGTGASARTVQSKLRDVVNVLDFGAVGDGVTNDRTAIQNAINSLPSNGGIVRFPVGKYKITSGLTLGSRVSLIGDVKASWVTGVGGLAFDGGAAIVPTFAGDVVTITGTAGHDTNCAIENLTILGDKATYVTGNGFVLSACIGVIFRNCKVKNIGGHGFITGDAPATSFHNYFYNCYSYFNGGNGYEVRSDWCRIIDCWGDGNVNPINFPSTNGGGYARIVNFHSEEWTGVGIKISGGAGFNKILNPQMFGRRSSVSGGTGHAIQLDTSVNTAQANDNSVIGGEIIYQTTYEANTGTIGIDIQAGALNNDLVDVTLSGFATNLNINATAVNTRAIGATLDNGTTANAAIANATTVLDGVIFRTSGTNSVSGTVGLTAMGCSFDKTPLVASTANISACTGYGDGAAFTPTLTFGNGSTGMTFSAQTGRWMKNGRWVSGTIHLTLTAKGSSTGTARIAGLPITVASGGGVAPLPIFVINSATITDFPMYGYVNPSDGKIYLVAANNVTVDDTYFANNTDFYLSFGYES